MSSPADDLAGRISALEGEVARLRDRIALSTADSTGARLLAAGADREVSGMRSELRAHVRVLEALRQTQLEQGEQLTALRSEVQSEFADLRGETGELRSDLQTGFATLQVGMTQVAGLLERIGPEQA